MAPKAPKPHPSVAVKRPRSVFLKTAAVEWRGLFKGIVKGIGHTAIGKWEEVGNDVVETLASLGVETEPGELASLLIRRSLVRALYDLFAENVAPRVSELTADHSPFEEMLESKIAASELVIDRSFLDRPQGIALVGELENVLQEWLRFNGISESLAAAIADRLPAYFVYALNNEWRKNGKRYQPILSAIDTPFTKAGEREWGWSLYSSLLGRRLAEPIFDEPFSLSQLYVPLLAYYVEDTTSSSSLETGRRTQRMVVDLEQELSEWLDGDESPIRVLSGGPGSGKSSFARSFAADVSKRGPCKVLFVPLHLIDPTRDVADEVGRFVRDEGILQFNPLDAASPESNLLVIFDGLDELASQGKAAAETARAFLRQVDKLVEVRNLHETRLRVLLSGREVVVQESESEFRQPRQVLCLLPYVVSDDDKHVFHKGSLVGYHDPKSLMDRDLRAIWWEKYSRLTGREFGDIGSLLARSDLQELTGQPLLNYLLALSVSRGKLDLSGSVNLNVIYSDLVAAVYERAYERKRPYAPISTTVLES